MCKCVFNSGVTRRGNIEEMREGRFGFQPALVVELVEQQKSQGQDSN